MLVGTCVQLYRACRKGYYKSPGLCRVWLLPGLRVCKHRGEYFTNHVDSETGLEYVGPNVLAHFITQFYFHKHVPEIHSRYGKDGKLEFTSPYAEQIEK